MLSLSVVSKRLINNYSMLFLLSISDYKQLIDVQTPY